MEEEEGEEKEKRQRMNNKDKDMEGGMDLLPLCNKSTAMITVSSL